jgi:hypothetical protein
MCAKEKHTPTKLKSTLHSAKVSHHIHIETTTIQRKVLSHTFRNNESKVANKDKKETRLKAMSKVLSGDCSEDSGSETRQEKPESQEDAAENNKSQANTIQGSTRKSNMVTRQAQFHRDVVKKNESQKEQTVANPLVNDNTDDDDDATILAPNFVCGDEKQASEPENLIYSSDSISDSEEIEVLKSINKTALKSKQLIIDQFHDDHVEIEVLSQDSELLAHLATSQRINTANSSDMNTQMTNTPDKNSLASFNVHKTNEEDDCIFDINSQKDGSISPLLVRSQDFSHSSSSAVQITTEGALKIHQNNINTKAKTVPEVVYLAPQGSSNQKQDCMKYIKAKPAIPQQQVINAEGQLVTYPIANNAAMSVINPNVIFMIPEQPQQLQQPISNVYNIYNSTNRAKFKKIKKKKLKCKAKCSKWVVTNVEESSESEKEKVQTKKQKKSDKYETQSKKKLNKKQSEKKQVSICESENEIVKVEAEPHLNKANKKVIKEAVVITKQVVELENRIKRRVIQTSENANLRQTRQRKSENANVDPLVQIKEHQNSAKQSNSSEADSESEEEIKIVRPKYINTRLQQKQKLNELEHKICDTTKKQNLRTQENTNALSSSDKQEQYPNRYTELKELEKLSPINEDTLITSDSSFSGEQLNSMKNSDQLQFQRIVPASDSSSESDEEEEREKNVNMRSRRWKDKEERQPEQRKSPRISKYKYKIMKFYIFFIILLL